MTPDSESIVRKRLEKMFGTQLPKRKLVIGYDSDGFPKLHEFDLVSKDLEILGEIKSCRVNDASFKGSLNDCFYLSRIKAKRKMMVLTNKDFCDYFKKKSDGLISEEIEVILVKV